MKKIFWFLSITLLSFVLVACGGNTDGEDQSDNGSTNESTTTEDNTDDTQQEETDQADDQTTDDDQDSAGEADDMMQKMDELDYKDFELAVDYGQDKEFEADIEQKNNGVEADLEDDINGENLNAEAAFDKIYPNVEKLNIDKDTDKEDAIAQVLEAFELDDNYEEFELEIKFKDGNKIEFEDRK